MIHSPRSLDSSIHLSTRVDRTSSLWSGGNREKSRMEQSLLSLDELLTTLPVMTRCCSSVLLLLLQSCHTLMELNQDLDHAHIRCILNYDKRQTLTRERRREM